MQNNATSNSHSIPQAGHKLPSPSVKGGFVVNLAASTTPVTLVQPPHEALKGYTFFVSRRREDGRERFRLHMGYFASQHDAELMLDAVREIFPAAWAGVAPGRKLAAEAAGVKAVSPAVLEVPQVHVANIVPEPPVPTLSRARPPAPPPVAAGRPAHQAASDSLNSVRDAIAALDDDGRASLEVKQRSSAEAAELKLLSDTQTMRLLESRKLKELADKEATHNAPPIPDFAGYVVQLRWSMRPIDISQMPAMAIFDAYTLYSAEGENGLQSWYGLRLGFFNDADSARQVANYVRSEFPSVSVVPIATDERNGAQHAVRGTAAAKPLKPANTSGEFRLIEDSRAGKPATPPATQATAPTVQPPVAPPVAPALPTVQPAPVKSKSGKAAVKQTPAPRRAPLTLEETLEILGANTLRLEDKKGAGLSARDSAAMLHAARRKSPQKSKLSQLFEKLASRA